MNATITIEITEKTKIALDDAVREESISPINLSLRPSKIICSFAVFEIYGSRL